MITTLFVAMSLMPNVTGASAPAYNNTASSLEPSPMNKNAASLQGRSTNADVTTIVSTGDASPEAPPRLSGTAVSVIMTPLCLSVFLSALDLTIITPAIPAIVNSFKSVTGYVWIGSAFILASTAITPVWGSVADIWGRKPIILMSLAVFLGGSLLCALAPNMHSLIAGRAI